MFGLTMEKLLVAAVIAALVLGPHRLPAYAARLGRLVRGVRAFVDAARAAAEREAGALVPMDDWEASLRQYDPRSIVREAMRTPTVADASAKREPDAPPVSPAGAG